MISGFTNSFVIIVNFVFNFFVFIPELIIIYNYDDDNEYLADHCRSLFTDKVTTCNIPKKFV